MSEKSASDWHSLKTAGASTFKCLIFPDSQSSDYSDWENLAQTAATLNPDAAFFINMGDIVDNGEDHTQNRLTIKCFLPDGQEIDQAVVEKQA